jgi:Mn-dependent DtxR family transcriptional regulator
LNVGIDLTALEVLQAISRKPRITPIMISDDLKMKQQSVRNILLTLSELGLVVNAARGVYEISEIGQEILEKHKTSRKA